jgi:hypothetical protein
MPMETMRCGYVGGASSNEAPLVWGKMRHWRGALPAMSSSRHSADFSDPQFVYAPAAQKKNQSGP